MKTKLSKIMGIGFALVLVASMMLFAIPAAAGPYDDLVAFPSNMWLPFDPTPSLPGGWFNDPAITKIGPIAEGIDGDLYAYVAGTAATPLNGGTDDIFKSTDGGRTWSASAIPAYYAGGPVVDMVCSSLSEDVLYLTDGNYVYKSVNGGLSFMLVAPESLEFELMGCCGTTITDLPITSIDLTYDGGNEPVVFIGTRQVIDTGTGLPRVYSAPHPDVGKPVVGSVYWISDERFPAEWADLQMRCYGACCDITSGTPIGCFDVYSVGAAPDFAVTNKAYALISKPITLEFYDTGAATVTITADAGGATILYAPDPLPASITYTKPATPAAANPQPIPAGELATFASDGSADAKVSVSVLSGTVTIAETVGPDNVLVCPASTQVVSTVGTICSWAFVSELCWNCDAARNFEIRHGSRFAFPDDFTDTRTMFIGVAGTYNNNGTAHNYADDFYGPGGDVYSVSDTIPPSTPALDLNVQGYSSGCLGRIHANINSLDIMGGTDDGSLIAGALDGFEPAIPGGPQYGTDVFYSTDGGWSWDDSDKDPTGVDETYVLWYGESALATTKWCDCAVSMSCGDEVGKYWNQISLINTCIDSVEDLTHAPGYLDGGSDMFVLTFCDDSCVHRGSDDSNSLFRWDGTYWERVFSTLAHEFNIEITAGDGLMDWVEVSPDYNDTDCLYLANTSFDIFRSIDRGCSWRILSYPCAPKESISAWIVVDEETILAAGGTPDAGTLFRTMRHGTRPWDEFPILNSLGGAACSGVDFDLSLPRGATSDVLFGDACGQVYISYDLGETWAEIEDALDPMGPDFAGDTDQTYVVFDPGYGTAGDPGENMIYAAAGSDVGRCDINSAALWTLQDWVYICPAAATCDTCGVCLASGIDAAGDTALYVADAGDPTSVAATVTVDGTVMVECVACTIGGCGGDFTFTTQPVITTGTTAFISGELVQIVGSNLTCVTTCVDDETDTCTFTLAGQIDFVGLSSGAVGYITFTAKTPATYSCVECVCPGGGTCSSNGVVISGHLLITSTAGTEACPSGVWRSLNPMDLMPPAFNFPLVEWEFLSLGLDPTSTLRHPVASSSFSIYPDDLWLTSGSNVLWALDRAEVASPYTIWMWDDPLATPVIQISPANGALLPTTSSATLEWEPLDGATHYEVYIYSFCAACPENMVPFDDFVTDLTCIVVDGLTPGTTYYWKVRVACDSPVVSKWSTLRSFDTALSAVPYLCSPICGADDVILTTNYSWDAVLGATSYELQIVAAGADGTADWTGAATLTTDVNAMASIPGLEYSTVYYWRVRAVSDGVYSAWAVCLFTTIAEPVEPPAPTPPVEVITEEITPTWIWVIIGIGAALVICVIILIVTTRRVP